ncbi:MAG: hypothetical protein ACI9H6_000561 [Patiriisocius sp.]|jgi:hypothetical protein
MLLIRTFVIVILATLLIPAASAATERDRINACLSANWEGVIRNGQDIGTVFDLDRLASTSIGPAMRSLSQQQRADSSHMVALAIKSALEQNLNRLRQLEYRPSDLPWDFETFPRSYRVTGSLEHRTKNTSYDVRVVVGKSTCKISSMGIEGFLLRNWIQETPEFIAFMQQTDA